MIARRNGFNRGRRRREREERCHVCEEDAIIITVLVERTREIFLISSYVLSVFFLYLSIVYGLWDARAHVYNKQGFMYVSKIYVCAEEKRMRTFLFFLFFFSIVIECRRWRQNGLCVRKRKNISPEESKSCYKRTTIDDRSIGNSVSSTLALTLFYYGNT